MSGYIAMSRNWQDHDLFLGDEFSRRDAWAWLIANAAWKPTKTRIKGVGITLERGQMCFSVRFLAEKWGWSKSRVDRFIAALRAEGMIETCSKIGTVSGHPAGQGQSVLTVCNYDKFQAPLKGERDTTRPESGTTAGQQRDKEEEGNNVIPLANANGEVDFWANARTYLKPHTKGDPGGLIGKWLRDNGKELTIAAINAAQLERAFDPVAYITGYFRRHSSGRAQPAVPL